MPKEILPEWEQVLVAAANLQPILPDAVLPQPNDESALQPLQIQLAQPLPYDLEEHNLSEYKNLQPRWQNVKDSCLDDATIIFDRIGGLGV
jgi:hypothetical protein